MKAKIWSDLLKVIAAFALLFGVIWSALHFLPSSTLGPLKGESANLISLEDEQRFGDFLADQLAIEYDLVEDVPELDTALAVITERLQAALGESPYTYTFTVISSPEINAFALPGGHIFIYSGLIQTTDQPEELAAVLAHEMGHVEDRHTVKKLLKNFSIALITSITIGSDVLLADELLSSVLSTRFDRKYEKQADDFALDLLVEADLSPKHMARVFQKFKDAESETGGPLEILSTHPNTHNRFERAYTHPIPDDFEERPLTIDWTAVKEAL